MSYIVAFCRAIAFRDEGQSFVELGVAMAVLSVAVMGVIGAMGLGVVLTGGSRQQSAASAIANQYLERARNIQTYENVLTSDQPTHVADSTSPDYKVTTDNKSYQVDATTTEPLLVAAGGFPHTDAVNNPNGTTQFSVYRYVTCVDDPQIATNTGCKDSAGNQLASGDYRRVTVVVSWSNAVAQGSTHSISQSTFVGAPNVSLATPSPTASAAPTSTPTTSTPSPGPTSTPAEACSGDVTAPTASMSIVSPAGASQGYTNTESVQVSLSANDSCTPIAALLANPASQCSSASFTTVATSSASPLSATVSWTVPWTRPSDDGPKTICAQFKDGNLNTATSSAIVVLDKTVPTAPVLSKTMCNISGNTRIVTMSWNANSDANLSGYRIYQSINNALVSVPPARPTTSSTLYSDSPTGTKKTDTVQYSVTAYDKAGNESQQSNAISSSASKNPC